MLLIVFLLLGLIKPKLEEIGEKELKESVIDQNEISLKLDAQASSIEFVPKTGRPENFLGVRDLSSGDL